MTDLDRIHLSRRLVLSLRAHEVAALHGLQVRLAKVLAQLWEIYAELLEVHAALEVDASDEKPVTLADFRPGLTLEVGSSCAHTDPRRVLVHRLDLDGWKERLGGLASAVLDAPELARLEVLALLDELSAGELDEVAKFVAEEETSTDELPVIKPPRTSSRQ